MIQKRTSGIHRGHVFIGVEVRVAGSPSLMPAGPGIEIGGDVSEGGLVGSAPRLAGREEVGGSESGNATSWRGGGIEEVILITSGAPELGRGHLDLAPFAGGEKVVEIEVGPA